MYSNEFSKTQYIKGEAQRNAGTTADCSEAKAGAGKGKEEALEDEKNRSKPAMLQN
jgi:hypothetical protein